MNERKHFFRDEQDNRTVVVTRMTQQGHYIAYQSEGPANSFLRGKGHSRLAAIADLNEVLARQEEVQ